MPHSKNEKYELTFAGGASTYAREVIGHIRRWHRTFGSAEKTALHVLSRFDVDGTRAAHPAIIYGPDINQDGFTIR
jgi:predicted N-acetyltransferase YhbS